MVGVAAGVQCKLTDFTGVNVVMFFNVICTPWAQIVIDQRTRPLIQVFLVMSWVKVKIAELTMLCDDLGGGAAAVGALDSVRFVGALVLCCWFPYFEP